MILKEASLKFDMKLQAEFPSSQKFPPLFRTKVAVELKEAIKWFRQLDIENAPDGVDLDCGCDVVKYHLLPCRHIFYAHLMGVAPMTDEIFKEDYVDHLEEKGIEIYEDYEAVPNDEELESFSNVLERMTLKQKVETERQMALHFDMKKFAEGQSESMLIFLFLTEHFSLLPL